MLSCALVVVLLVLVARGQRWFQQYEDYVAYFDRGSGLDAGAEVLIKGLSAGMVSKIGLDRYDRVRVDLKIFKQYADRIRERSEIELSSPMIGSAKLSINPGPQDSKPIQPGGLITSTQEAGADFDALIESAKDLVSDLDDPKGDLKQAIANINIATKEISNSIASKKGSLGMLIGERELYDHLISITKQIDRIVGEIDRSTPDIRDSFSSARSGLEEANKVIRALEENFLIKGGIERQLGEMGSMRIEGRTK